MREGKPLNFSCQAGQFRTDINRGQRHGTFAPTLGSVFDRPLADRYGYTLWLELVAPTATYGGGYWLVWYDPFGAPTIMTNGLMEKNDIIQIRNTLRTFA